MARQGHGRALPGDEHEALLSAVLFGRALRHERMVTIACSNLAIVGLLQGEDARSWVCLAEVLKRVVLPEDSVTVAYGLATGFDRTAALTVSEWRLLIAASFAQLLVSIVVRATPFGAMRAAVSRRRRKWRAAVAVQ